MFQVVKSQILNHTGCNAHQPPTSSGGCTGDDNEELQSESDYVFDVKLSCDHKSLIVSSSDKAIHLYDLESFEFRRRISAHKDRISNIVCSRRSPTVLWTSSDDKTVKCWDLTSTSMAENKPSLTFRFEEEIQAFAVNQDDTLLAVGIGCDIHFFDVRKAANVKITNVMALGTLKSCELGSYSDVHSDIVTQLEFSPNQQNILLSGAEDGLICAFDTAADESEEAVVSILNIGCPIRKFGFFGPNFEGIYALSTVETASFWHYPSAQRLANFEDLREKLSVDYLVDCSFDTSFAKLQLLTGRYDGNGSLITILPGEYEPTEMGFFNQHSGMLRCFLPILDNQGHVHAYITGGEDGKLLLWKQEDELADNYQRGSRTELFSSGCNYERSMEVDVTEENTTPHEGPVSFDRPMTHNDSGVKRIIVESFHAHGLKRPHLHQSNDIDRPVPLKQKHKKKSHSGLRHQPY